MIDAWDIFRAVYILAWFAGAGAVSWFLIHFKPTRKILKKILPEMF